MAEPENISEPYFSIIILFWNNERHIITCLNSLANQTLDDFEVIIIDNGSSEPLNHALMQEFINLDIKIVQLPQNIGFSAGNNLGAEDARGKYLITLNADAFPEKDWLENIHKAIQKYPDCFFASKQVMANDPSRLDGAGDVYHFTGLGWHIQL